MMITRRRKYLSFQLLLLLSLLFAFDYRPKTTALLGVGVLGAIVFVSTVVEVTKTLPPGVAPPTQTRDAGTEALSTAIAPTKPEQQTGTQKTTAGDTKTTAAAPTSASENTIFSTIAAMSNTEVASTASTPLTTLATHRPESSTAPSPSPNTHKESTTIAISCSAIALAGMIGAIMCYLFRRRRRRQQSQNANTPSYSSSLKKPRKKIRKSQIRIVRASPLDLTTFKQPANEAELGLYTERSVPPPLNNPYWESEQRPPGVDAWDKRYMEENQRINSSMRSTSHSGQSSSSAPPRSPESSSKPSLYEQSDPTSRYYRPKIQISEQPSYQQKTPVSEQSSYITTRTDLEQQVRSLITETPRLPSFGGSVSSGEDGEQAWYSATESVWEYEYDEQQQNRRYPASSIYSRPEYGRWGTVQQQRATFWPEPIPETDLQEAQSTTTSIHSEGMVI